jgi:acyl carrier protein
VNTSPADVRAFLLARLGTSLREAGLDPETVGDDTDLFAAGIIDSLGVLELIALVSDQYGIEDDWEDYDPDDLLVVGPFCRYAAEKATTDGRAPS